MQGRQICHQLKGHMRLPISG